MMASGAMHPTWLAKLIDAGMTRPEASAWLDGADALATGEEPMRARRIDNAVDARVRQMRQPALPGFA